MAGIFISWGSPDANNVNKLRDRLKDLGLPIWEYSEDMPSGGQIHDKILNAINQVKVAIVCFSDETAERKWISDEVAWCVQNCKDITKKLKRVVPVWVGAHPDNKIPHLLEDLNLSVSDVTDLSTGVDTAAMAKLVRDVHKHLGSDAPMVLPAALFVMTKNQCRDLFRQDLPNGHLTGLCEATGMRVPPDTNLLLDRYGDKGSEDFSPFRANEPLSALMQGIVRRINASRARLGRRPIFLRWMQEELSDLANEEARSVWSGGYSLLIVDSLSAFHPDIRARILNLPDPADRARQAVLWVPPYTQHTAGLDRLLISTARAAVSRVADVLAQWEQQPERFIAFDSSTSDSIARWLHRALSEMPDDLPPLPVNIASVKPPGSSGVTLRELFSQTNGN